MNNSRITRRGLVAGGMVTLLAGCSNGAPTMVAPVVLTPLPAQAGETAPGNAAAGTLAEQPIATEAAPAVVATATVAPQPVATDPPAVAQQPPTTEAGAVPVAPTAAPVVQPTVAEAAQAVDPTAAPADNQSSGLPARPPAPAAPADGSLITLYRGPTDKKVVALTFDAGADRGYGEQILDTLRDEGIPGNFGMTGLYAQDNLDLVHRMVNEGHMIFNHTWDHKSFTGVSTGDDPMDAQTLIDELTRTADFIRAQTGYEVAPYFRPPYGDIGPITSGYVAQAGYYVDILWSCDSFGWNGFTADQIVPRCTGDEMGGQGAIILMHVGAAAAGDYEALPNLIDFYRQNGYTFQTIEQMLQ